VTDCVTASPAGLDLFLIWNLYYVYRAVFAVWRLSSDLGRFLLFRRTFQRYYCRNKIPNQKLILILISKITHQSLVFLSDESGGSGNLPLSWQRPRYSCRSHRPSQHLTSNIQPPIPQDRLVRHYSHFNLTFIDTPKTTAWHRRKCSPRLPFSTSHSFPFLLHP